MNSSLSPHHMVNLHPLRGIAALAVLLLHCHQLVSPLTTTATELVNKGYLAVDFFFVLSGLVLAYRYETYFNESVSRFDYKRYLLARCRRILPVYLLTLLFTFLVGAVLLSCTTGLSPFWRRVFSTGGAVSSILLVQGFPIHQVAVWNMPSWSLSVEWWMYAAFPFHPWIKTVSGIRNAYIRLSIIVFLYALLIGYLVPVFGVHHASTLDFGPDLGFLRCAIGFSAGLVTYQFYQNKHLMNQLTGSWQWPLVVIIIGYCMHTGESDMLIISFFPLLLLATLAVKGRVQRLLHHPLGRWLGDRSYSIYLVQMPVIFALYAWYAVDNPRLLLDGTDVLPLNPDLIKGWSLSIPVIVGTLYLSDLIYQRIEQPFRQAKKTLLS